MTGLLRLEQERLSPSFIRSDKQDGLLQKAADSRENATPGAAHRPQRLCFTVCFTGFRAGHWAARLVVDQSDSDLQVTVVDDENDPLTARVRQRDVAALAEYVDTHRKPLLVFIERQLGPGLRRKIEVEDILQEVSVEAVRALPETDLGERKIFSWLCQLAERRIIDAHRRFFGAQKRDAGREVPLGSPGGDSEHAAIIDLLVASMTTPTQALSRNMKEVRLLEALATLPADQREALRLRYVENLPSKDIAARLGKSDGSVRVMLTRALARLNQMLGPDAMPR
jgi:RNA polymerase sigma-70 factor (ECF subfamily)